MANHISNGVLTTLSHLFGSTPACVCYTRSPFHDLFTGFGTFIFGNIFSQQSEASPPPFAPWMEKMHSWNSEASPNGSSYSNWWVYKMFVKQSQPAEFESLWPEHFISFFPKSFFFLGWGLGRGRVGLGVAQLLCFSDKLISATLTWCDEWYDLLMLTYSRSMEKKGSWSDKQMCSSNCLISLLQQ